MALDTLTLVLKGRERHSIFAGRAESDAELRYVLRLESHQESPYSELCLAGKVRGAVSLLSKEVGEVCHLLLPNLIKHELTLKLAYDLGFGENSRRIGSLAYEGLKEVLINPALTNHSRLLRIALEKQNVREHAVLERNGINA